MTPKKKTATSTTLKMERKRIQMDNNAATQVNTSSNGNSSSTTTTPGRKDSFLAGGKNAGIVVNKEIDKEGKFLSTFKYCLVLHVKFLKF